LARFELHLSARATPRERAEAAVEVAVDQVADVLGLDAFSRDGRPLEQVVGDLLSERGFRIALAESCTGGLLTSRLTDVPGSSRYVERAVVAYANDAKTALLHVPEATISEHGAVSEQVAVAMAEGIKANALVDVGVGVTGIAGPGGGTPRNPWGLWPSRSRSRARRVRASFDLPETGSR
jgi:nicotinamide-nucleotide amidase